MPLYFSPLHFSQQQYRSIIQKASHFDKPIKNERFAFALLFYGNPSSASSCCGLPLYYSAKNCYNL